MCEIKTLQYVEVVLKNNCLINPADKTDARVMGRVQLYPKQNLSLPGLFCIGVCILRISCRSLLTFHCNNGGHSGPVTEAG